MTEYELELLEGIRHSLEEIVVEMKATNRLLGDSCMIADKRKKFPKGLPDGYKVGK